MEPLDLLLSDAYVRFARSIISYHEAKERLKDQFETYQDEYLANIREIDKSVLTLQKEFEAFKKEREANIGDG